MIDLLFLISVPIFIGICSLIVFWFRYSDEYELSDYLGAQEIGLGIWVLLIIIIYLAGRVAKIYDTEVWNGRVVSKVKVRVQCEHSYQCMCYESCSGEDGHESCTRVCQTCYEHPYDIDWDLNTDLEGTIHIARLDSQGLREPPRWAIAKPGDPVAELHEFKNYPLAADYSLFHPLSLADPAQLAKVPKYPLTIYDYEYLDRVFAIDVKLPDISLWNLKLAKALEILGPEKQANAEIVVVGSPDTSWADAIVDKWRGAKKNDIVISIGVNSSLDILWANVYSWSDSDLFKVTLRDDILKIGSVASPDPIIAALAAETLKLFTRKSMKDFYYLRYEIKPPKPLLYVLWFINIVGCIITLIVFVSTGERIREEESRPNYYYR